MIGLEDKEECKSALSAVREAIPRAKYVTDLYSGIRPAGCYYFGDIYWNTNSQGGPCSSCRSVCKGWTLILFNCGGCNII